MSATRPARNAASARPRSTFSGTRLSNHAKFPAKMADDEKKKDAAEPEKPAEPVDEPVATATPQQEEEPKAAKPATPPPAAALGSRDLPAGISLAVAAI